MPGGKGRVEQSIPDVLLPYGKVIPRKDSPGVHSTGRIGGVALCGQGAVGDYLDSKIESVTSLKIRLQLQWLRDFFCFFASALLLRRTALGCFADALLFAEAPLIFKSLSQSRNLVLHRDPDIKALRYGR